MIPIDFLARAQTLRDEMVARRRDLHQHPEIAFEEVRTAGIVADTLQQLGLEVQTGIGKTGVVGILEGEGDGPTVLVRADMDALPVQEENDVAYASTISGKMHACGHDGHTTIALAVAKMLNEHRDKINGRVKFVFQPAEEIGAGASAMIADGVLNDPRPDVSLGLHLWNELPLGTVGMTDGPIMAMPGRFEVTITGRGGHGGQPHLTRDPVVCAAQIALALQTIVSRQADPLDTAVVSITRIESGSSFNVIPDTAFMGGTFRVFRHEVLEMVMHQIEHIAHHTATAMGCAAQVETAAFSVPVSNHADVVRRIKPVFGAMVGDDQLVPYRTMAAEDVSLFMDDIPGMYFFVGSRNDALGLNYGHHHPRFDFDEDALPLGAGLLASAVAEYLINPDMSE